MDALSKPRVVAVGGPTATGKTALSVALAKEFGGEIINADSMQVYKNLNVGTAKPTAEERQGIPHHLLDFLTPETPYSVADFTAAAAPLITQLNAQNRLPLVVGGTGLFDNDLLHGIIVCLVVQFLLYVIQKRMTVGEYFARFFSGVKGMTTIAVVVGFGLMLSDANRTLGLFDILINGIGGAVPRCLIAPLVFVLVGMTVFAVGGCWAVMTIAIPVFIPMGLAAGVAAPLMIAAVMSGVTLGYSLCFYADAVLMTTAGSGVSNLTTIRAATPYALAVGGLSVIALLVAGL